MSRGSGEIGEAFFFAGPSVVIGPKDFLGLGQELAKPLALEGRDGDRLVSLGERDRFVIREAVDLVEDQELRFLIEAKFAETCLLQFMKTRNTRIRR